MNDGVERVKAASDIVDVVGGYLALRTAGKTFKAVCPFHDDSRPSLDVDPQRQRYRCWACGKYGDVISFVQEIERVDFTEAMDLLARRAGISWRDREDSLQSGVRDRMLVAAAWAHHHFQEALWDRHLGSPARDYLEQRGLDEDTLKRFGVGWAPGTGNWLIQLARDHSIELEVLESIGLVGRQDSGSWYDRFRDRVQFPIRNPRGQTVGFGGRILPGSPAIDRVPKYYNSADSSIFSKSEQLFGIDLAREAARQSGWLAVVEGYTDVLMAHQCGVSSVVATMGTALNPRHLAQIRRHAGKVILVFDADAGGDAGVERALGLFARSELDLTVATLPEGKDPCDWLIEEGAEPFQRALNDAVDPLEFTLTRWFPEGIENRVEPMRRAVEKVLALLPEGASGSPEDLKAALMIGRLSRRLGVPEDSLWARRRESKQEQATAESRRRVDREPASATVEVVVEMEQIPQLERELVAVLLAFPEKVAEVAGRVAPEELDHPAARRLFLDLLGQVRAGEAPGMEGLRSIMSPARLGLALRLSDMARGHGEPGRWLEEMLASFERRRLREGRQQLQQRLQQASRGGDRAAAFDLLRKVQEEGRGASR